MLVKRFREVSAGPKTDLSVFVPPFHDMLIFVNTGKTVIQVKFPEDRYQAYFVDWNQTLKVRSRECAAQWTHDCDGSNFYRYKTDGAYGHKGVLSRFFHIFSCQFLLKLLLQCPSRFRMKDNPRSACTGNCWKLKNIGPLVYFAIWIRITLKGVKPEV